jgi:hypothetical protein
MDSAISPNNGSINYMPPGRILTVYVLSVFVGSRPFKGYSKDTNIASKKMTYRANL